MINKVFFNPRCSKSRTAAKFLEDNNIEYEKYLYLEDGISKKNIEEILEKGNLNINQILRNSELDYKANIRGLDLTDEEKIDVLVKYPKILQRPIVVSDNDAIVARDEESFKRII